MTTNRHRAISILCLSLFMTRALSAVTKTWTGNGGDNNFYNGANWDPAGTPISLDDLVIPGGTPPVEFPDSPFDSTGIFSCNSLTIAGVMNLASFRRLDVHGRFKLVDGGVLKILGKEDMEIVANVCDIAGGRILAAIPIRWRMSTMMNEGGRIEVTAHLEIAAGDIYNYGEIVCQSDPLAAKGGCIEIITRNFYNHRLIKAGDGLRGGDIRMTAYPDVDGRGGWITNTPEAVIQPGLGTHSAGSRIIKGKYIKDSGKNYSSPDMGKAAKACDLISTGEDMLAADTLILNGSEIWASSASFMGGYIKIKNIHSFGIEAVHQIDFYTSTGGHIDASENNEQGSIVSDSGSIHVYSDRLLGPAQGTDWLFNPDPAVLPPDTGATDLWIHFEPVLRDTNQSGKVHVPFQNFSTGVRTFQCSIYSQEGWLTPVDSTVTLPAFGAGYVQAHWAVPSDARTLDTDTVVAVLSAVPGYSVSDTSYILCKNGLPFSSGAGTGESAQFPQGYRLFQNSPNPFNPSTEIGFSLPVTRRVVLKIFDVHGREWGTPVDREYAPGRHSVPFNASALPAGLYLYQIRMGGFTGAKKMLVIK